MQIKSPGDSKSTMLPPRQKAAWKANVNRIFSALPCCQQIVKVNDTRSTSLSNYCSEFILSIAPYILYLIIIGLNSKIHILAGTSDSHLVYNLSYIEYKMFGFHPNNLVSSLSLFPLDFCAALPYILHYVLPVLYPVYLIVKGRLDDIIRFYNLLGCFLWLQYIIWYLFPTAPPWYYDNLLQYETEGHTPPLDQQHREGCAFRRVDAAVGYPLFFNIFASNPAPFGAFPSGHVAWPSAICATNPPFGNACWLYVLHMSWAAMYSCHHYISDIVVSLLIIYMLKRGLQRNRKQLDPFEV